MSGLGVEYGVKYTLTGPDGTIAVFNDETDPNYVGVLDPTECSGLDSPDVREDAADLTEDDGGIHGDFFYGRRPVVLAGMIRATSVTQRNERAAKLQGATNAMRADAVLKWKPTGGSEVELKLRRQQPLRIVGPFNKKFQAALVSAEANIYSSAEKSSAHDLEKIVTTDPTTQTTAAIATDATYIYYVREKNIIRAKLNGTEKTTLITAAAAGTINGIAVNATHIFWTDTGNSGQIGRATITGASLNQSYVTAPTTPKGIAVDGTFIYWAEAGAEGSIGRVKLTAETPEATWITTPTTNVTHVAVNATHVFWGLASERDIGRATIAGATPTNTFAENVAAIGSTITAMTIDASFIYYGHESAATVTGGGVGRVKIDGTENAQNWALFTSTSGPVGSRKPTALSNQGTKLYYSAGSGFVAEGVTYVLEKSPQLTITNSGNTGTGAVITISGPIYDIFELTNKTTEDKLVIEADNPPEVEVFGGINREEKLEIDLTNHTVYEIRKTGERVSRYDFVQFASSDWFKFAPGATTLEVDQPVDITVAYKDAWL